MRVEHLKNKLIRAFFQTSSFFTVTDDYIIQSSNRDIMHHFGLTKNRRIRGSFIFDFITHLNLNQHSYLIERMVVHISDHSSQFHTMHSISDIIRDTVCIRRQHCGIQLDWIYCLRLSNKSYIQ